MREQCVDEFKEYDLPFETYFNACIDHDETKHEDMEFIWLLEGNIRIICEGVSFDLTSDNVFMIYMNQVHSIVSDGQSISISFRLKKSYTDALNLSFNKIPFKNRIYSFEELANKYHEVPLIMSSLIILMKSQSPSLNVRYKIIGYYNMYIYDLYSVRLKDRYLDIKKKNYDEYLIRFYTIVDYINKNYSQKLTLDTLSELVEISSFRLSHFIKEILGISFQDYLRNVRFDHALDYLRNTNMPIDEVVRKCGFSDPKYLSQMMNERFHLTALKYRKIMRDNKHFGIQGYSYPKMVSELSSRLNKIPQYADMTDTFGLKQNVFDAQGE
ncbi:MAG: AraC family transcriptional regulator [Erysipelotrichaceae bacterium]|nr:AraC family transcriptional regulator [Erysipelotrichaceae bacterium]